jgi:GcrA cell cycle regulator
MTAPAPWTSDRVTALRRMWAEGLSGGQIAARLGGTTRNAVIGKVHRLGLSKRATTVRTKSRRPRQLRTPAVPRPPAPRQVPYVPPEELVIPPAERVAFGDLESRHCHWPIGDPHDADFAFCGRPAARGRPYCDYHHARSCRDTRGEV